MKVLFLGTSSGAGKTTIAAMFCRYLKNRGVRVAPFKASNLSLNSFATADGREIGRGQAFQALACGIPPTSDMNPVLLKPSGSGIQVILDGKPYKDIGKGGSGRETFIENALEAYDRLCSEFEAVVCEGSGSPAEINLRDRDIANMTLARERSIPAVLIGDIDRGGVFAGLYGTWKLIPEEDRHLLRGFIINRFRGDPSILRSGIDRMTELTGMEYLGVMPMTDLRFPDEDSLSISRGKLEGDDIQNAYLMNLDEFLSVAEDNLLLENIVRIAEH